MSLGTRPAIQVNYHAEPRAASVQWASRGSGMDIQPKPRARPPRVGEPAPWFACRTGRRERFAFHTIAGRYIVLAFWGSGSAPAARAPRARLAAAGRRLADGALSF